MTSNPFSAQCTNMFEETHITSEPRTLGAENLYYSQSQSRKIFDTTMTSISANPLQNYNVPNLTMNNGDSALHNPCINYAQPVPVAGGGFLFSFPSPQQNCHNMFYTGQNLNYGHQQPNYSNNYHFMNKPNPFPSHQNPFSSLTSPPTSQENTQKETPFKLQFHLQRGTSTSDLPETKINDEDIAFVKKMNDFHHIWRDRSEMCQKLSHFEPFKQYGKNKILHLSKSPDLKTKKGKFYEIDISQECDTCQNNIWQTLQLFENEKNDLFFNKTCTNKAEINTKEKERTETTTVGTATLNDLKDESFQTESNIWNNKKVPMDITDNIKIENEKNIKKALISDNSSKNLQENYSDENFKEMPNKKVKDLLTYFPRSISRKFRLLENEITNLLLKTIQMSEDGKCNFSDDNLESIRKEETDLQPKNCDLKLFNCLTNKGRAEKRHFPEFESDNDNFDLQTNKILRLTKSTDQDIRSQNKNEFDKLIIVDEQTICKTLSDKSVPCNESISNLKPKNFDTKSIETVSLDCLTKTQDTINNTDYMTSQILSQADEQIQKWHDIIIKKLQMFENGVREVFMTTKDFSINNSEIEINSKDTDYFNKDTVSCIGSFLDKIIMLQKFPDILDKINKLKEEVTKTCSEYSNVAHKPELIIPGENLRLNHGLENDQERGLLEIKLSPNPSRHEMDFDNFSLKKSKRKFGNVDPTVYSNSDYSATKKTNLDFERKAASENYIHGLWKTNKNHLFTPKYNSTKNIEKHFVINQNSFNLKKYNISTDIKKSNGFDSNSVHYSNREIINSHPPDCINTTPLQEITNNYENEIEMSQTENKKSISKIIDDIHTQIWGSDQNPKQDFKKSNSFDNYKLNQNEQPKKNAVLILRPQLNPNKIRSETRIVNQNFGTKFQPDDNQTDSKISNSNSFQKSKFLEDNKNSFTKSIEDFQTSSKTMKSFKDFEMSKSIVDIINKVNEDSEAKHFQKDDNKKYTLMSEVVQKDEEATPIRKTKSLTSINEEIEPSEKSTEQIHTWQKKIPRAFANENTELSKSKMYLFENWRKKLQENKLSTKGSKSNLYQRPSFKKKVPRALWSDDNKNDIEVSLESYDKSTREMEKKLNKALQRYNKTAKVTDEISNKITETSNADLLFSTATTPRTFLADSEQMFLSKVQNALKIKLNGNFKISDVPNGECRDNSTLEPSMSFDDEEIRSVEYSRSYVIRSTDDIDKDEKNSEN